MIRAVIDTNVLISSLINPLGKPAEIMGLIYSGRIKAITTAQILSEYDEVLKRAKFSFARSEVNNVLSFFNKQRIAVPAEDITSIDTPEDDAVFVIAARCGLADYLVTGNIKDYLRLKNETYTIVKPEELLKIIRKTI